MIYNKFKSWLALACRLMVKTERFDLTLDTNDRSRIACVGLRTTLNLTIHNVIDKKVAYNIDLPISGHQCRHGGAARRITGMSRV